MLATASAGPWTDESAPMALSTTINPTLSLRLWWHILTLSHAMAWNLSVCLHSKMKRFCITLKGFHCSCS